jgi:putative glutamine amidotransferase
MRKITEKRRKIKMPRPVIGILSNLRGSDPDLSVISKTVSVSNAYILSVAGSGGIPLILPPVADDGAVDEMIEKVDGLLVTGGNDLSTQLYGEEPCKKQGQFSPERDHLDLASIRAAFRREKPILGVCRGIQAINVCFGGTLYQDLEQEKEFTVKHYQESESSCVSHTVKIQQNSVLFPLLGEEVLTNSFHHQAVKKVADGFAVGALAKDGVVEAIELGKGPFVLGIQWHPEMMTAAGDRTMKRIFDLFLDACKK